MKKNQIIRNKTTGETLTMLVSDEENGGACQLYEVHLPPHRPGPQLHYHVDFLFSHSKAMSRIEQFVAECNRSLTPVRGHQSVSIPEQRGHGEGSPLRVCNLASMRNELECSMERLAVDDERELTAKVWLLVVDTHACTQDAPSGGRAERTRLPIQNALAKEGVLLCGVRFSTICS
jgi:hypothetical protein